MTRPALLRVVLAIAVLLALQSPSASANSPPVAVIASPEDGAFFLDTDLVLLSAEGTYDPDGGELNYTWKLGDAPVAYGSEVNLSFSAGRYNLTLVVRDAGGAEGHASVLIVVDEWVPPHPTEDKVDPQVVYALLFLLIAVLLALGYHLWRRWRYRYVDSPSWIE